MIAQTPVTIYCQTLLKLVHDCRIYSKPKQCHSRYTVYISGVHIFPGSAETLVRRGGITNNLSLAYSLSNVYAKNYENWLTCIEVIVCYISVVFCDTV